MGHLTSFLRETSLGQAIRLVTRSRVLKYPEEQAGFNLPDSGLIDNAMHSSSKENHQNDASADIEKRNGPTSNAAAEGVPYSAHEMHSPGPDCVAEDVIIVGWYGDDDPENPYNWPQWKKVYLHLTVNIYTFAVYLASSIYTPAIPELQRVYGVSGITASLGLGLYTLGYGLGPLIFGPPSEIAAIGRNSVYAITLFLFVVLSIPTALVDNIPGLMVLRFLQGLFCAPGLANVAGSIGDITSTLTRPYALYVWAFFPLAGPSLGPVIGGFSVPAKNWRWAMWEIVWISGFSLVNILLLPETSSSTILYRRASRLRAVTGRPVYRSRTEISQQHLSVANIARDSLLIPWKINALDPSVLFTSLYCGLVYGIFYSFFEVFPLVYIDIYGMNWGEMGLVFLTVLVAVGVVGAPYLIFIHLVVDPAVRESRHLEPEVRLIPGVCASVLLPVGLFIFAWTARSGIHWIVPTIGVLFASGAVCIIIQCIYVYLSLAYPQYAASLIGANTFCRGVVALGAVLWSTPLYHALGVSRGTSLLAGLCGGCVLGMFVLWRWGPALRRRSRFAVADTTI